MNEEKFTGKAEAYAGARPQYSEEFISYLFDEVGFQEGCTVADIGSGTGILSRQLAENGAQVTCVEPNSDMLAEAKVYLQEFENCMFIQRPAEDTGLEPCSVDFVTAAQAFHWFDMPRFRAECQRVLRPKGKVILVWNHRCDDAPVILALAKVNREFCPAFKGFSGGMSEESAQISAFFKDGVFCRRSFSNVQFSTRSQWIERSLSSSYAPKKGDLQYDSYCLALGKLFDEYTTGGCIEVPYLTQSYVGEV